MKRALALVAASAAILAACGSDGGSTVADDDESRTIEVSMTDMAFAPQRIDATDGETITFAFRNDGSVRHEAVFGDLAEQEQHHADMAAQGGSHDGMEMGSAPPEHMTELHSVIVEPGETVEMTHVVDGATMIGCHEPGHWEAGMRMAIDV